MIFHKLHSEDKAGLYLTVIIHLVVVIILLLWQIGREVAAEDTFVMDFSKQEEIEKQEAERAFKEDIHERLEELIRSHKNEIRNVAVDASTPLKDDRNTPTDQLYEEAERLKQEILENQRTPDWEESALAMEEKKKEEKKSDETRYGGPSVLSYNLDGRKASRLKIPAYQCYGGGIVTVIIGVNTSGKVVEARIMGAESSQDNCLREFALNAARASLFSASPTAPHKQYGTICYSFVSQ